MAEHPKRVGDRSTLAIMLALFDRGFDVYLPFGENTRCDLILDSGGNMLRVQCKTGRLRNGTVRFALCSTYGHHPNPQPHRSYQGEVDAFAVFCPDTGAVYLIPMEVLPGKRAAWLRVTPTLNNQARHVRLAADYEIGRVAIEGLRAPSGA